MDKITMNEIAEEAYVEENLPWAVSNIVLNKDNGDEWEIYYDAWGRKYHKILFRTTTTADSTRESVKAEMKNFLRELKESGSL